jgi:carbon starvation protein CstA
MKPDERKTPAVTKEDGVDYVPMKQWRNSLINLLNIAGTGPVLGPIQGILFGPIAFILIPIGCVLGGAMHDYFSGMLAIRNEGGQMPDLVKKYTNGPIFNVYMVFVSLLLFLVGAVFIYTPGDIAATQIFKFSGAPTAISTWVIYGVIFVYYIAATVFPIDKIIGRVYPVFGAILLFSAVGIFIGLMTRGYPLDELSALNWMGIHPSQNLVPIFFITVACGIVSGFHSTQTALISRSVVSEKQGRNTFYNMMILEGFIAMIWAAAAMGVMNLGMADASTAPTAVVGIVALDMLGPVGGIIALLGVIVLPVTSGDTALRSLRLMISDRMGYDQKPMKNRLLLSGGIFAVVAAVLIWAKFSAEGFQVLWRYFAWSNQTIAIFAFAIIAIYLFGRGYKAAPFMSLIPGAWYTFVTVSFIMNAAIGFNIPMNIAYIIGVVAALAYSVAVYRTGVKLHESKAPIEAAAVYA